MAQKLDFDGAPIPFGMRFAEKVTGEPVQLDGEYDDLRQIHVSRRETPLFGAGTFETYTTKSRTIDPATGTGPWDYYTHTVTD